MAKTFISMFQSSALKYCRTNQYNKFHSLLISNEYIISWLQQQAMEIVLNEL